MKPQFVPGLHFDCLLEILSMYREGRLRDEWLQAMQHGSWFVGCAAAQFDTTPDDLIGTEDPGPIPVALEAQLKMLEEVIPGDNSYAITPSQIALIIRLVLEILRQL